MGSSQNCFCCHKHRHLIFSLLFILVSSLNQVGFIAEGRAITKLIEAAHNGMEEEKMMSMRIGSRPPRCDRRCSTCEHCEAVQVPVTTKAQSHRRSHFTTATPTVAYARGDDISNYKAMSWKCKCGNMIFNP
ncbi:hypothetical protein CFOL_v3_16668 [Cephalotus follicularis]|uniref:Epidermal patterning factor-like protein n=1 Tax=Cephalotus follicularis TaxID=3775 RepID=A0A1Q3BZ64_CEPFO|nr:hypothetical protein CFOL_v3_16668 [Cephalotus follicularis]